MGKHNTALTEEMGLVPKAYTGWLTTICNSNSMEPNNLFWSQEALQTCGAYTCIQAITYTHKEKFKKLF